MGDLDRIFRTLMLLLMLTAGILMSTIQAQHQTDHYFERDTDTHSFKHWRISGMTGYTLLPTKTIDGKESLILPTLGLDVEYWFSPQWGVGMHNDIELLVFEVEREEDLFIEREFPLLFTVDVLWKPVGDMVLYLGPGVEIEPTEDFFVFRTGIEYEFEIPGHWDVYPSVFYDYREGAYDTFTFGLGVGKRF